MAPRFDAAQASRVEVASAACNTGASARSSAPPLAFRAEKAVVFTITSGLKRSNRLAQKRLARLFLQTGDECRFHRHASRGKRVGERDDWRVSVRKKKGAIENQQRAPRVRAGRPSRRAAIAGALNARAFAPGRGYADEAGHEAEQGAHVLRAAVLKEGPYAHAILRRQRRGLAQTLIVQIVARNDGQRKTLRARQGRELLDAVRPVFLAAKQPDHDKTRVARHLVEIKIDGKGVFQLRERSAAQAGARGGVFVVNARQQAKLGVREGQKNDFPRRLFEIDRRARVVESVKIAGEQMHGVTTTRVAGRRAPGRGPFGR